LVNSVLFIVNWAIAKISWSDCRLLANVFWVNFLQLKSCIILRPNPIENQAISGFSGQTSGTRIILSILQSFLHFLEAKYINNCPGNNTENNFPWEREKMNFKVQGTFANTGKIPPSVSFYQYFQVFHTKVNIRFQHLVLLEMIFFFKKIFKTVAQKFAMQCKFIILVLGFCPFVTGISGGFCLTAQRWYSLPLWLLYSGPNL